MELGNLIFGHGVSDVSIPRNRKWEIPLFDLLEKLAGKNEVAYTYGMDFVSTLFEVHPYYWGDCTCGFSDLEEKWYVEHQHGSDCFIALLEKRLLVLQQSVEYRRTAEPDRRIDLEKTVAVRLAKELGITTSSGSYNICTCHYKDEETEFYRQNTHTDNCLLEVPNFWYKPTGYKMYWYKYALRDTYANMKISLKDYKQMMKHCLESLP